MPRVFVPGLPTAAAERAASAGPLADFASRLARHISAVHAKVTAAAVAGEGCSMVLVAPQPMSARRAASAVQRASSNHSFLLGRDSPAGLHRTASLPSEQSIARFRSSTGGGGDFDFDTASASPVPAAGACKPAVGDRVPGLPCCCAAASVDPSTGTMLAVVLSSLDMPASGDQADGVCELFAGRQVPRHATTSASAEPSGSTCGIEACAAHAMQWKPLGWYCARDVASVIASHANSCRLWMDAGAATGITGVDCLAAASLSALMDASAEWLSDGAADGHSWPLACGLDHLQAVLADVTGSQAPGVDSTGSRTDESPFSDDTVLADQSVHAAPTAGTPGDGSSERTVSPLAAVAATLEASAASPLPRSRDTASTVNVTPPAPLAADGTVACRDGSLLLPLTDGLSISSHAHLSAVDVCRCLIDCVAAAVGWRIADCVPAAGQRMRAVLAFDHLDGSSTMITVTCSSSGETSVVAVRRVEGQCPSEEGCDAGAAGAAGTDSDDDDDECMDAAAHPASAGDRVVASGHGVAAFYAHHAAAITACWRTEATDVPLGVALWESARRFDALSEVCATIGALAPYVALRCVPAPALDAAGGGGHASAVSLIALDWSAETPSGVAVKCRVLLDPSPAWAVDASADSDSAPTMRSHVCWVVPPSCQCTGDGSTSSSGTSAECVSAALLASCAAACSAEAGSAGAQLRAIVAGCLDVLDAALATWA